MLLNAGWELAQIEDLISDKELLDYADVITVNSSEKKYYKVTDTQTTELTESQCFYEINELKRDFITNLTTENSGISALSISPGDTLKDEIYTSDGYFTYFVQAYYKGGGKFILSARYEWLISPKNLRIDVFGLGHGNTLTKNISSSDVHYVYKADIPDLTNGTTYPYQTTVPDETKIDAGGVVVKQKLNGDPTGVNHRGYLRYDAVTSESTVKAFEAFAEYYHQQGIYSVSPSISFPLGGGVSISNSSFFKLMSPNPHIGGEI